MDVIWTAKARITFLRILDYLDENWTKKEIIQFNERTQIVIGAIIKNPGIFPGSTKNKEIRKAYIDKNNSLFYKIDLLSKKIYLLTFFDSRQDPRKLIT
jgi:plasmid stabilization system protein ParE